MSGRLPPDRKLDEFVQGGAQLAQGAERLSTGVRTIEAALPASITRIQGSASGLADSVEPKVEVVAPVANNGSAFVPNMVSVALWIGAVMAGYLFNIRIVLSDHSHYPKLAKTLGKITMPALIVLLQVALVLATLVGVLQVQAFRAVMFGAFDNGWAHACGAVLLSGAVAVGLMAIFGKWNEVLPADYKPTIQV